MRTIPAPHAHVEELKPCVVRPPESQPAGALCTLSVAPPSEVAMEAILAKLHDDEASRTMLTTVQKIMNNVIEHAEGHARSAKSST